MEVKGDNGDGQRLVEGAEELCWGEVVNGH